MTTESRIRIAVDSSGAESGTRRVNTALRGTQQQAQQSGQATRGLERRFGGLQRAAVGLGAAITAAFSVRAITNFTRTAVSEFADMEQSLWRIERQAELMEHAWADTEYIQEYAREMGRATLGSAEDVRRATSLLLTQQDLTQESYEQTIRVSLSLAEVTGVNMPTAARYMTRAMTDASGAMSMFQRYGLTFTEQQRDQIRALQDSGREAEAYNSMLELMAQRLPDASEGGTTLAHSLDTAGEKTRELREEIGRHLAPRIDDLVGEYTEWIDANQKIINQRVDEAVQTTATALENAVKAYKGTPSEVRDGIGLIAASMFGVKGAGAYLLLKQLPEISTGIRALQAAIAGEISWGDYLTTHTAEGLQKLLDDVADSARELKEQTQEAAKEGLGQMSREMERLQNLIQVMERSEMPDDQIDSYRQRVKELRLVVQGFDEDFYDLSKAIDNTGDSTDEANDKSKNWLATYDKMSDAKKDILGQVYELGEQAFPTLSEAFQGMSGQVEDHIGDLESTRAAYKQLAEDMGIIVRSIEEEWVRIADVTQGFEDAVTSSAQELERLHASMDRVSGTAFPTLSDEMRSMQAQIDDMDFMTFADHVERGLWDATTVGVRGLRSLEDALVDTAMTGKLEMRDMVDSILRDLIRLQVQQAITEPLAEGIGGIFSGSDFSGRQPIGPVTTATLHDGGVVGKEGSPGIAPASMFAGAPRFHTGLRSEEYPAILEKGESVLTEGQMQALGSAVGGGGTQDVRVHIHNESEQKMQVTDSKAGFDAQGMIIDLWLDGFERNKKGLRSRLGG